MSDTDEELERKHEHEEHECCCCHDSGDECCEKQEEHHNHHEHNHSSGHHHCSCCDDDDDEHEHHHHGDDEEEEEGDLKKIAISAVLFICALLVEHLPFFESFNPLYVRIGYVALYAVAYLLTGLEVIHEAIESLMKGKVFGEEFLMTVATVGAIAMGEFSEAVAVMILFQIGEFLEDFAVDKSKKSITSLMDIRPDKANIKVGNDITEILAQDVKIGDVIVVKAGERVPLDGKIISGSTLVDTSALTGESVPREVVTGDEVMSGFVNTSGIIEVEVTKVFGESTVSRVLEMVQNAQSKKAQAQRFISRFAKVYTPIVCGLSLCIAIIPSLVIVFGGIGLEGYESINSVWKTWIYRALEILVVSCPCALVISVPLSFFAGIGLASKNGILVKGSNYIEMLASMNTAVFDKTGTLTKGVFEVSDIHLSASATLNTEELIALATHAEYYSNHPISRSLKNVHHCEMCENLKGNDVQEISGHGVKCVIDGKTVLAGNKKLMDKEGVTGYEDCEKTDGGTIIHVALGGVYQGHIVISDQAKDDAKYAITSLHNAGVKNIVMLTGDAESAAKATAVQLVLDEVYAGLLPQDKVSKIESFIKANEGTKNRVAFVGDGINDAPVLSRSDVGIAMGGLGSDAAIEAADVVIMDDMPSKVAVAVKIAKKTMLNVRENVTFALVIKVLIMVLCSLGIANMWVAVFGDVGVTMIAVLNAMRIMKSKLK